MSRDVRDTRDETLRNGYEYVINEPRAWRETATNLNRAADMIASHCRLDFPQEPTDENVAQAEDTARLLGPLLLLRASAVECLLKGLY